jgi:hypothetical protein
MKPERTRSRELTLKYMLPMAVEIDSVDCESEHTGEIRNNVSDPTLGVPGCPVIDLAYCSGVKVA